MIQKPQQALNLLVTKERYWALFYMPVVTEERYWALFYMPLYTFIHNLRIVLVQIADKLNSVDFSPQANYNDRATTACRRN
jgi:hypothetical protein